MKFELKSYIFFNKIGIKVSSGCGFSFKSIEIYTIKTEPCIKTPEPFVVIDQGPVEISSHIDTVFKAPLKDIYMSFNEFYFFLAIMGGNAIFRNYYRNVQVGCVLHDLFKASGMDLPSRIRESVAIGVLMP